MIISPAWDFINISYWDTPSKIDQCRSFKCVIKHNAPYRIKVANTSTTLSGICIPYTFCCMWTCSHRFKIKVFVHIHFIIYLFLTFWNSNYMSICPCKSDQSTLSNKMFFLKPFEFIHMNIYHLSFFSFFLNLWYLYQ